MGYITVSLLTTDVNFDQTLIIRDNDDQPHKYMLQGVVYFGSSHFVSCIVDDNLDAWFNDGIATKRKYIREKVLWEFRTSEFTCQILATVCTILAL